MSPKYIRDVVVARLAVMSLFLIVSSQRTLRVRAFSTVAPVAKQKNSCKGNASRPLCFPTGNVYKPFLPSLPRPNTQGECVLKRNLSASATSKSDTKTVTPVPDPLPTLKNDYFLLRHGQSTANVAGIISSARSLANTDKHGLTQLGYQQGVESAMNLLNMVEREYDDNNNDEEGGKIQRRKVYFYSSPFARAKQTAEACLDGLDMEDALNKAEMLGLEIQKEIKLEDGLMERFFGRLDGEALLTYAYVWPVDMFDPTHTAFDVESVAAVSTRIRDTLTRIDDSAEHAIGGDIIVLVSHADVLQITQVYAAGLDNVGKFSQYRFGNGEVRAMKRTVDSLPEPVPLKPPKAGT